MLYRQYRDQYANMGRMAMQDTMGQAAGLTGGYGSSYGQSVGQQQYNAYLQQLNQVVPELYNQAYQHYRDDVNDQLQQYSILQNRADDEYNKYLNEYNQWLTDRNYNTDLENQMYNRGYNEWRDAYDIYNTDRNFDYQQYLNDRNFNYQQTNADREYQLALDKWNYQKEQDALAQAAAEQAAAGGGSGTKVGYDKHGYTEDMIKSLQKNAGLKQTGVWGENEKQAYKAGYRADGDNGNTSGNTSVDNANLGDIYTKYDAEVAMRKNGADRKYAQKLMREDEFNKSIYSTEMTYQEYLRDMVQFAIDEAKK